MILLTLSFDRRMAVYGRPMVLNPYDNRVYCYEAAGGLPSMEYAEMQVTTAQKY